MLRFLKTFSREINAVSCGTKALVILSLVLLVLKVLWLNSIPQLFYKGAELGEIVDGLCSSILSGFIFYFIVVHLKSERDKEAVIPYVSSQVQRIVGDCLAQLVAFQNASGVELDLETLKNEDVKTAFKKIDPKGQTSLILGLGGQSANWLQLIDFYRTRTTQAIEKLFRRIEILDSLLVRHLANIDDCSHFANMQSIEGASGTIMNSSLEAWASSFFEYCVFARELNEYEKSKFAYYRPAPVPQIWAQAGKW